MGRRRDDGAAAPIPTEVVHMKTVKIDTHMNAQVIGYLFPLGRIVTLCSRYEPGTRGAFVLSMYSGVREQDTIHVTEAWSNE